MVRARTLLERIADPDPHEDQTVALDTNQLRRSVFAHLRKMLNSRHDQAPAQPDYGIPDLNEFMFSMPESISPMRQAIQSSIEKYEPRLRNVVATWVPDEDDPFSIRFDIKARLISDTGEMPITFHTNVGSARIEVDG